MRNREVSLVWNITYSFRMRLQSWNFACTLITLGSWLWMAWEFRYSRQKFLKQNSLLTEWPSYQQISKRITIIWVYVIFCAFAYPSDELHLRYDDIFEKFWEWLDDHQNQDLKRQEGHTTGSPAGISEFLSPPEYSVHLEPLQIELQCFEVL